MTVLHLGACIQWIFIYRNMYLKPIVYSTSTDSIQILRHKIEQGFQ